jgi:predicted DNA-binding antitoxin AbrB/MazE fold protein
MTTTVEAIYEMDVLKLPNALPLPERAHVLVTITSQTEPGEDAERSTWLRLSEEALTKTWDAPSDDVFNELLKR